MSWNYRIVEKTTDEETTRGIYEVYYSDGILTQITVNPIDFVWYSDEDDDAVLCQILESFNKPVLKYEDFIDKVPF